MSELAQAIADLGKAAEQRSYNRQDLLRATQVVADAIAKHLGTGDSISLTEKSAPGVTYQVRAILWMSGPTSYKGAIALCRNGAVLGSPPDTHYRRVADPTGQTIMHVATAEERTAFVLEAPKVVARFTDLLQKEARQWESGAEKIAKPAT